MKHRAGIIFLFLAFGILFFHNAVPHHHHGEIPVRIINPANDHCDEHAAHGPHPTSCSLGSITFTPARTMQSRPLCWIQVDQQFMDIADDPAYHQPGIVFAGFIQHPQKVPESAPCAGRRLGRAPPLLSSID